MKFLLQIFAISLLCLGFATPCAARAAAVTPLAIHTGQGEARFTVELAETPSAIAYGLMHRSALPDDRGMLFLFERPRIARMWMKNTLVPLDMLFLGDDGGILRIEENTVPESEAVISSDVAVTAVLEVPAGTAKRIGARVGDRVVHEGLKANAVSR